MLGGGHPRYCGDGVGGSEREKIHNLMSKSLNLSLGPDELVVEDHGVARRTLG